MPKTCRTVEYFFEMTNQTVAPDGVERMGLVINGMYIDKCVIQS